MINQFLKDIMDSIPHFWDMVSEAKLPVSKREKTITKFDDVLAGVLIVMVPLQFCFANLAPRTDFSFGAAATAIGLTVLLALFALGGLARLVSQPDDVDRIYQGWVAAVFTGWFTATGLITLSIYFAPKILIWMGQSGRVSGDLFTAWRGDDLQPNFSGWLSFFAYSIAAMLVLFAIRTIFEAVRKHPDTGAQSAPRYEGNQRPDNVGATKLAFRTLGSYAFCAFLVSLLVWFNYFLLAGGS